MNYFTNGVISDEYFIVEGYKKYAKGGERIADEAGNGIVT